MKFAHINSVEVREDNHQSFPLILLDDNTDFVLKDLESNNQLSNEEYTVVAQVISLDIRGDFGFFLNKRKENRLDYEWAGNLFHITVRPSLERVEIMETLGEEITYSIPWVEWEDALMDWKQFYLKELGFLEFDNSMALSHVVGVLILTFDQMTEGICKMEMITEAIKRCSERYGISKSVLYRDCKKTLGLAHIKEFYILAQCILYEQCGEKQLLDSIFRGISCQGHMFDKTYCGGCDRFCRINHNILCDNFWKIRDSFRHKLGLGEV